MVLLIFSLDALVAYARPSRLPGGDVFSLRCSSNIEVLQSDDFYVNIGGGDIYATNAVAANAPFAEEVMSWCFHFGAPLLLNNTWIISWHVEGSDVGTTFGLSKDDVGSCAGPPGVTWEKFNNVLISADHTGSGGTNGFGVCALVRRLPSSLYESAP